MDYLRGLIGRDTRSITVSGREVKLIDNEPPGQFADAIHFLLQQDEVAVDMEGVNHGRNGKLCIIQMCAKEGPVYLFDITKLGAGGLSSSNYTQSLRDIFESHSICKVMFDVRTDSDALWHLYRTRIYNAYDIQVLHTFKFSSHTDDYLKGLAKVLNDYPGNGPVEKARLDAIKLKGKKLFVSDEGGDPTVWEKRPLHTDLIMYAAADLPDLLNMKNLWGSVRFKAHVLRTTENRVKDQIYDSHPVVGKNRAKRDFDLQGFGVAEGWTNSAGEYFGPPSDDDLDLDECETFDDYFASEGVYDYDDF